MTGRYVCDVTGGTCHISCFVPAIWAQNSYFRHLIYYHTRIFSLGLTFDKVFVSSIFPIYDGVLTGSNRNKKKSMPVAMPLLYPDNCF